MAWALQDRKLELGRSSNTVAGDWAEMAVKLGGQNEEMLDIWRSSLRGERQSRRLFAVDSKAELAQLFS